MSVQTNLEKHVFGCVGPTRHICLVWSIALGCMFLPRVQLLSSGATLVVGRYFCRRVQLLPPGATFVVGCYFCRRVFAYLLGESMACALVFRMRFTIQGPDRSHPGGVGAFARHDDDNDDDTVFSPATGPQSHRAQG